MKRKIIMAAAAALCLVLIVPVLAFGMGNLPTGHVPATLERKAASEASAQVVAWRGFVDADGDGLCDNCGSGNAGNGPGYVDADGDGLCDNRAAVSSAGGHHHGHGAACSSGYSDADGDGICDNYADRGQGAGRQGGHRAHHP